MFIISYYTYLLYRPVYVWFVAMTLVCQFHKTRCYFVILFVILKYLAFCWQC
uniref:Uncharacterized protein n=1 Tax=Anguilla anguilla TaxID=7936 RepID=A0A0E9X7Y2_ANGAN